MDNMTLQHAYNITRYFSNFDRYIEEREEITEKLEIEESDDTPSFDEINKPL